MHQNVTLNEEVKKENQQNLNLSRRLNQSKSKLKIKAKQRIKNSIEDNEPVNLKSGSPGKLKRGLISPSKPSNNRASCETSNFEN
jgi:hypothetical protein